MAAHYGKNSGSGIADQLLADYQIFKVADQREAEALFSNSGPAEADYGKNSGCPPLFNSHRVSLEEVDRRL